MASSTKPLTLLELEPMASAASVPVTQDVPAAVPAEPPPANPESERDEAERYLEAATREFDAGWIERPLWESMLAQAKGDEAFAKKSYLRTRATMLKIEKRDRVNAPPAPSVAPSMPAPSRGAPAANDDDDVRAASRAALRRIDPRPAWMNPRNVAIAVAALVAVMAVSWFAMSGSEPTTDAGAATTVAAARPVVHVTPAQVVASVPVDDGLIARVAATQAVGNWNVVVLLASEWTRRDPANGQAWMALSEGYSHLNQSAEALDAATRATSVAASDPRTWRMLGLVYSALDRSAEAAAAFEHAVALDGQDIDSLVRLGTVDITLNRLPQAQAAFDRVLASHPANVDALCGQITVAKQQGRASDAEAVRRQLQAAQLSCNDVVTAVNAAAATPAPAPAAAPPRRSFGRSGSLEAGR